MHASNLANTFKFMLQKTNFNTAAIQDMHYIKLDCICNKEAVLSIAFASPIRLISHQASGAGRGEKTIKYACMGVELNQYKQKVIRSNMGRQATSESALPPSNH